MLLTLALCALQGNPTTSPLPLPPRDYQPRQIDPGLHGGRPVNYALPNGVALKSPGGGGDLTPDGRLWVFTRQVWWDAPAGQTSGLRTALQVAAVDPERMVRSDTDLSFYEPDTSGSEVTVEGIELYGDDYAMPRFDTLDTDQDVAKPVMWLEWSPPTLDSQGSGCSAGFDALDVDNLPGGRVRFLTLGLRPMPAAFPSFGANPYLDASGRLTYELFLVMVHTPLLVDQEPCLECEKFTLSSEGYWQFALNPGGVCPTDKGLPRLMGRTLKVVLDPNVSPPLIESVDLGQAQRLQLASPKGAGGLDIVGTEPTITADCRLLVFHGDGGSNNVTGQQAITYVFNDSPELDLMNGWSEPKSITSLHTDSAIDPNRYPLARYPIREPRSTDGSYATYAPGDPFRGPYPWINKDGSFLMSTHARSNDAEAGGSQVAQRSSMIAFGSITQGFVKLVDDAGLNPTRLGAYMVWPVTGDPEWDLPRDTQMTSFFSTGLKPGFWQPFLGDEVAIPATPSDQRIPSMPVFVHQTRSYGEVRFEEADGNYALYLACNEALRSAESPFENEQEPDPTRTPDTSGREQRIVCSLEGAFFPQEDSCLPGPLGETRGLALNGSTSLPANENVGFKGQAILFPRESWISIAEPLSYGDQVTVQAFVKVLPGWDDEPLILFDDPGDAGAGRLRLELDADGRFVATVTVDTASQTGQVKQVFSRVSAITQEPDYYDRTAGWRHVAVTFDGETSRLEIYLDGQFDEAEEWSSEGPSTLTGSPGNAHVGPKGTAAYGCPVLLLDEVAVSSVVRTVEELRRDAYVAPLPDGSKPWPGPDMDPGLNEEEAYWPEDVDYSPVVVNMGRILFDSPILSPVELNRKCTTCHIPQYGFAEPFPLASDCNGQSMKFNTPSLFNMAFGKEKLFDGSAATLEDQVLRPILSGIELDPLGMSTVCVGEMGVQTIDEVLARINAIDDAEALFEQEFGTPATASNLAQTLAMYLRTLNSGGSRVDQFEAGDLTALNGDEIKGRALFHGKARCVTCHSGSNYSDNRFHNIGTVDSESDVSGWGGFTGRVNEEGMLKTPSLRNLFFPAAEFGSFTATGPYFHNGSKTNLEQVLLHYNGGGVPEAQAGIRGTLDRGLFPLGLSGPELEDLEAFLKALVDPTPPQ